MRRLLLSLALLALTGCKSHYINITVSNHTGGPISLLEVDYPSAGFGTDSVAAGADFHYRFKIIGSGKIKVSWLDAAHKEHHGTGPELKEGDEGQLTVLLDPSSATWSSLFKSVQTR